MKRLRFIKAILCIVPVLVIGIISIYILMNTPEKKFVYNNNLNKTDNATDTLNINNASNTADNGSEKITGDNKAITDEITVSYDITLLSNGEEVITISSLTDEETDFIKSVIFDFLIKSAAFPGVDVNKLDEYYLIQTHFSDDTATSYYTYILDDMPVMQLGKDGYYSRINNRLYENLVNLVQKHIDSIGTTAHKVING